MTSSLSAIIENVTIVDEVDQNGSFMDKGLGMIKARVSLAGAGTHAEYSIKVRQSSQPFYTIKKRFSEFSALHNFLTQRFGPNIPVSLPGKTYIRYFDQEKLEDRKNALNSYLKDICSRPEYLACPEVLEFFNPQVPGTSHDPTVPGTSHEPTGGGLPSTSGSGVPTAGASSTVPARTQQPAAKKTIGRHDSEDDLVGWDS